MSELQRIPNAPTPFGALCLDIWTGIIEECIGYNSKDKTHYLKHGYEAMSKLNDSFLAEVARALAMRKHISFNCGRDFVSFWRGLVINNNSLLIKKIEYIHIHLVDPRDAMVVIPALSCLDQGFDNKIHITFDHVELHKVVQVTPPGPTWFEILASFTGEYQLDRTLKTTIAKINAGQGHEPSHKPRTIYLSRVLRQDELPEFRQVEEQFLQLKLNLKNVDGLAILRCGIYVLQLVLQLSEFRGELTGTNLATWQAAMVLYRQQVDTADPIPDRLPFDFDKLA